MSDVLIAYTTNSGSTDAVARAVGDELAQCGLEVEVRRIEEIESVAGYRSVIVGGPMIMGWHREAAKFLKRHESALNHIPVALFFTCMSLTQTGDTQVQDVPVFVDPALPQPPKKPGRLTFKERYATLPKYLGPVLRSVPAVTPVSAAFFGGRLELFRLKLLQMLFVMIIIGAQPGDRRNWNAVREWSTGLAPLLRQGQEQSADAVKTG